MPLIQTILVITEPSAPLVYEVRGDSSSHFISILILLSIALLAFARFANGQVFMHVLRFSFRVQGLYEAIRESFRLNSISSVLLLFNFYLSFFISVYLLLSRSNVLSLREVLMVSLASPLLVFLWQTYGLFFAGIISGNRRALRSPVVNTLVLLQSFGILLALLNFVWYLNPYYHQVCLLIFYAVCLLVVSGRILKNLVIGINNNISWYYLILYLCTLEILPVWVAYYYVATNFVG